MGERKSAGALIVSKSSKRFLLGLRSENTSYSGTWGLFGGKVNFNEKIIKGLERELKEEIGKIGKILRIIPINIYTHPTKHYDYYSYLIIVENEFIPELNQEHNGYAWIKMDAWPKPLHPSVKKLLSSKLLKKSIQNIL